MIVNVRGTNGSGKSTAVRMFAESVGGFDAMEKAYDPGRRRPTYYLHRRHGFVIIGHYEAQCGGADTLKYGEVRPTVLSLHSEGWNVVYESMLFSVESKQALLMHETVDDVRVIHLVTSVGRCLENIYARREASGRRLGTDLDEWRVGFNHEKVSQMRRKLEAAGVTCKRASVEQAARWMRVWLCGGGTRGG